MARKVLIQNFHLQIYSIKYSCFICQHSISYSTKLDHHELGDLDRLRDILSYDIHTFHFVWSTTRTILKISDVLSISIDLVC